MGKTKKDKPVRARSGIYRKTLVHESKKSKAKKKPKYPFDYDKAKRGE